MRFVKVLALVLLSTSLYAETVVRCESDGRRRLCSADTSNGVHMSRQLSRSDCVEGRSWGFTNRGIWVDNGCRAEFTLGHAHGGGYGRRAETLVCESEYGRSHTCRADTRRGVRLTHQLSRTDCVFRRTWGYDDEGVWVRNGCRAEFLIGGR